MKQKTTLVLAVILTAWLCVGCGNTKTIDGIEYGTYGLLNKDDKKNPHVQYELIWGNVIWGGLLCETIIALYIFTDFLCGSLLGKRQE